MTQRVTKAAVAETSTGREDTANNLLKFWGKAQPQDPESGPEWHPLAYHCLDVAAVGDALMSAELGHGSHIARLLEISRPETQALVRYLLALHDIGKFAKKFQAKVPHLYPSFLSDDPSRVPTHYDHGAGGLQLFNTNSEAFMLPENTSERTWRPLISAVAGHHGSPPEFDLQEGLLVLRSDFGPPGLKAALHFVQQLHALLPPPGALPVLKPQSAKLASHLVAGLAVLADWIGSNQQWFGYHEPRHDLDSYWSLAMDQAKRAVREAGVLPSAAIPAIGYVDLIGPRATPTPMQHWAQDFRLPRGPALFIIEDETGSGKTEAAMMLAHRLMAAGAGHGLYIALPTMATANAMFDRLASAYRLFFSEDTTPSIALAHGARDMHTGFRAAMAWNNRKEKPYSLDANGDATETTASAACSAWIADDRRRAFLADAGAGTIDQALLSVLPCRHQSLRLLGLAQRVLVLDEVHAYDAYMHREMERLLEFQAGLGGSAILLSATLPQSAKARLTGAFAKGLKPNAVVDVSNSDYPSVTVCAPATVSCTRIPGQANRARRLPVRFIRSFESAIDAVETASRSGRAVLYIRNTVDDALEAYEALTARSLEVTLFHARFALIDRLNREREVVEAFGKRSTHPMRRGKVLVATQVVEQSLDLDFDALVTDLAPIDLLIQRAGRLWRHKRPERRGSPELLVMGPEPTDDANENWFGSVFPRAQYVYRDHARLWLTARELQCKGAIASPGELRSLIESVYGEDAPEAVPSGLTDSLWDAEGREGADRSIANTNLLRLSQGYLRDAGAWDSDARTSTRIDEDPQVTLRLGRLTNGEIQAYAQTKEPIELWRAWRLSELNVTARRVTGEAIPDDLKALANTAKEAWTRFDSDKILVILGETDTNTQTSFGMVSSGTEAHGKIRLSYNSRYGLGHAPAETT